MTLSYNLLDEQWIPVLWTDGNVSQVGILEALTRADSIRQIAASNPMDRVAIFRFLLALLYWCRGNPPNTTDTSFKKSFPNDWFSRLDANRECFNLLGDGKRFYQYREQDDKLLTVNYLIHEIPSGTNFNHFRHSIDGTNGLCPACCALGLLRLPLFSTSGGRGKPPGINNKPPIYVIPVGETLAETLRLSWRHMPHSETPGTLGTPAWETPNVQLPRTEKVPLLTGLTWLPRRVWLSEPQQGSPTRCILCGRLANVIRSSVFAGIGSAKTDDGTKRVWYDPHVIYEKNKKGDIDSLHSTNALDDPDAAAAQWTRLLAEILRNRNSGTTIWVVGFSTVQNDKYLEATESFLHLPILTQDAADFSIAMLKQWQQPNFGLTKELKPPNEEPSRNHVEITTVLSNIRPHVESKVSAKAEELLSGENTVWEHAASEYRPMMQIVARSLSPGVTTAAVERRREIGNMLPQMGQTSTALKKPARGKRGSK